MCAFGLYFPKALNSTGAKSVSVCIESNYAASMNM